MGRPAARPQGMLQPQWSESAPGAAGAREERERGGSVGDERQRSCLRPAEREGRELALRRSGRCGRFRTGSSRRPIMIQSIPLNKLTPSPRNVRRSSDEAADRQLKADIAARGLLQNLVVAPAKKPRGCFTVEAGGRRLRALQALAEDGTLEAAHEVSCLVIASGASDAREASLAENFSRLAMNPADECLAFGQLIEQGADVEGIARRFGVTARFVEGRLRLSALAPVVFDALGAGEITLDVAKPYAAGA